MLVSMSWSFFLIVILFTSDTCCFFKFSLISSMEQEDSCELLTTPRDMLRDLCGYALIFILWKVVIFKIRSAYFFFATSTMRVLLRVAFTDLGATFAEKNLSIAKGESLVIGFSSVDSRTMNLGKVVTSSMSLSLSLSVSVSVSVSGCDLFGCLFGIRWFFF